MDNSLIPKLSKVMRDDKTGVLYLACSHMMELNVNDSRRNGTFKNLMYEEAVTFLLDHCEEIAEVFTEDEREKFFKYLKDLV